MLSRREKLPRRENLTNELVRVVSDMVFNKEANDPQFIL